MITLYQKGDVKKEEYETNFQLAPKKMFYSGQIQTLTEKIYHFFFMVELMVTGYWPWPFSCLE